ncbi:hypothetical protein KVR01_008239 [Diaporthe batatas]|uniref:uncharacterized protein n=1 Tax=Diaporthe batatas TaxID=748121 RepID=UPI001D059D3C|nr:uncharacterized protein KVR01_008239 [Diaporthe batatas]KAG8162474.1 hypothetical protein KVR01_008239 [Diaporthe batatas]
MTLSFLRSWRRATCDNLITRIGLASRASAPARPSRRLTTQAVWPRELCRAPARHLPHSPVECQKSSGPTIPRLYSHQATAKDSDAAALSLAPDGAVTSFQRRRLRARQSIAAQANPSQDSAVRAPRKRPNKKSQPHNARRRMIERFFETWGPVEAADVEHLQAVQAAVEAAKKAEDLARWAEKSTEAASAAFASSHQALAIQLADAARTEADIAALDAEHKAQLAADKEEAAEALRTETRVRLERQTPFLVEDRSRSGLENKLKGLVTTSCRICHAPHPLTKCPLLFPALDREESVVHPIHRHLFNDKLALNNKFHESIDFIQSKFKVPTGSGRFRGTSVIPLHSSVTRDAPGLAIKMLQEFDHSVFFRQIMRQKSHPSPARAPVGTKLELQAGHYITKDDDGRTFGIYWPINAPADIATDPRFLPEVQKIRSFVTEWGKGKKARYGQDPFSDMPSIDIVFCVGRWHRTRRGSDDMNRAVLSLWISNEELWKQGLYYKGIHIGTKDDEITSEYDWWSYGRPEMHGSPVIDLRGTPVPSSTSEMRLIDARNLLRANLRSVEESMPSIPAQSSSLGKPELLAQLDYDMYLRRAGRRVKEKYGRGSVQSRLQKRILRGPIRVSAVGRFYPQWEPSWEMMINPDQHTQALDAQKPSPLFRTLRRRRLLRTPRPPPASDSPSTEHPPRVISKSPSTETPPWARDYRMRSIMSPDTAPGTAAAGSGVEPPPVDAVSTPSASSSQQKTPGFQIRRTRYAAYTGSYNMTPSSETEATPTRQRRPFRRTRKAQEQPPPRSPTPRAEELPTTPEPAPEAAADGPEAEKPLVRRQASRPSKLRGLRGPGSRLAEILRGLDFDNLRLRPEPGEARERPRYHSRHLNIHKGRPRQESAVPDVGDA